MSTNRRTGDDAKNEKVDEAKKREGRNGAAAAATKKKKGSTDDGEEEEEEILEKDVEENFERLVNESCSSSPPQTKDETEAEERGRKISRKTIRKTVTTITRSTSRKRIRSRCLSDADLSRSSNLEEEEERTTSKNVRFPNEAATADGGGRSVFVHVEPRNSGDKNSSNNNSSSSSGKSCRSQSMTFPAQTTATPLPRTPLFGSDWKEEKKKDRNGASDAKDKSLDLKLAYGQNKESLRHAFLSSSMGSAKPNKSTPVEISPKSNGNAVGGKSFICPAEQAVGSPTCTVPKVKVIKIERSVPASAAAAEPKGILKKERPGEDNDDDNSVWPMKLVVTHHIIPKKKDKDASSSAAPSSLETLGSSTRPIDAWRIGLDVRATLTHMVNDRNVTMQGISRLMTYKDEFKFEYCCKEGYR